MQLPEDDPDLPPQINVAPVIDVIFAILAFFVVSTLFLTRSEGLPVNLPAADSGRVQPQSDATVTVDASGNLALDRQPIALADLPDAVADRVPPEGSLRAIVRADRAVPHGRVVAVMDALRSVPGVQLAIATEPTEGD